MNIHRHSFLTPVVLAAMLALGAGGAAAQGAASSAMAAPSGAMTPSAKSATPAADKMFAMQAAKGGMGEVALGQLAQQKAGSDAVKQFATHMVDDHTQANDELKQLASTKNITLPATPPMDAKAKKLESMSGAAFDKAYMAMMLDDHKKTIALFQKESTSGKDPDLKAFATKTLPTLKGHLDMVMQTRTTIAAAK